MTQATQAASPASPSTPAGTGSPHAASETQPFGSALAHCLAATRQPATTTGAESGSPLSAPTRWSALGGAPGAVASEAGKPAVAAAWPQDAAAAMAAVPPGSQPAAAPLAAAGAARSARFQASDKSHRDSTTDSRQDEASPAGSDPSTALTGMAIPLPPGTPPPPAPDYPGTSAATIAPAIPGDQAPAAPASTGAATAQPGNAAIDPTAPPQHGGLPRHGAADLADATTADPLRHAPAEAIPQAAAAATHATPDAGATAATMRGTSPGPTSPTAQLAPVLVSLTHAAGGAQRLTVRLEPAELGQVEIRVERLAGTPVRVDVTVQRPETLTLLLRDQSQLQRALDQAGLAPDGRSVTFHVAPAPATAMGGGTAGGSPFGAATGGGTNAGFSGQQSGQVGWNTTAEADDASDPAQTPLPPWLRAGLDITA